MIFSLDGREYTQIDIIDYIIKLETLDGEGTGRSRAGGWPLIRDPQGQIINLNLEFAGIDSTKSDFAHLWKTCRSMGKVDFVPVKFLDPLGEIISQKMYLVASELSYRRIQRDGKIFTNSLKVAFIAEKGL